MKILSAINFVGKRVWAVARIGIHILLKNICDKDYFQNIQEDISKIPESNGEKYYVPYNIPVAIVADEFLYNSFKGITDFKYITPDNYKLVCDEVEMLLVVTAWRGVHNEWKQMGYAGSDTNHVIYEAIRYFKEKGKKVVFYSKEDPPNYQFFLPLAKQCDIIFTSAIEKIEAYKRDCNNNRVYLMKFGVNPVYHNPIGCRLKKRKDEVIFSGSWIKKYPDRIKEQKMIFDGVLDAGKKLKIIDRNFELYNWGFFFPVKYYRYISPSIDHEHLQKVHKLYDWAINMNSVRDSRTMFANRIYELQAAGNLILSNESVGVREQFEEIFIVDSKKDVIKALTSYDDEEMYKRQIAGIRRIMRSETTFDRVGELLRNSGYEVCQPVRKVAVLAKEITENLKEDFERQTYPYKILLKLNEEADKELEKCDMISIWDESSEYGSFYLEDMINAFKYTNCDYVTKDSFMSNGVLNKGIEHNYVDSIRNVYATVLWKDAVDYLNILRLAGTFEVVSVDNGYSIDHFNYHQKA